MSLKWQIHYPFFVLSLQNVYLGFYWARNTKIRNPPYDTSNLKLHSLIDFELSMCYFSNVKPKLENREFKLVCLVKTKYHFQLGHWM